MSILDSAEALLQAKNYSGSGDWLDENNSHDAQFGTGTPGVADPLFKGFDASGQYVYLPGLSGNYLNTPDAAALDVTGDIDLRIRLAMEDWTPASTMDLITKQNTGGSRSYRLRIAASSKPILSWSENGSTEKTESSDTNLTVSDGDILWIRVTLDVDNGDTDAEAKFYTADGALANPSASDFTQLGATQLVGATTSIFASSSEVEVGAANLGTVGPLAADVLRAQIFDGIDGTLVFDCDLRDATEPFATFTERSSNAATITINRASSGRLASVIDRAQMLYTTDDYHEIADDAALDFATGDDFTLMAMFRTNTVAAGEDVLIAKKDNLTTSTGYALLRSTATGKGLIGDSSADDDDTVATVAIHTLHTVAMVRDAAGDNDIEAFLDGVASGSATTDSTTLTLANALPVRIGATSNTAANFFEGVIGAVAIWDSVLTPAQVLEAHERFTQFPAFPPFPRRQNTLVRM